MKHCDGLTHALDILLIRSRCGICKHTFTDEEVRMADLVASRKEDEHQQEHAWEERLPRNVS